MARVTVLGAGNAGHAIAFDMTLNKGCEVMLFEHPKFAKTLDGIKQRGGIEAVPELKTEAGKSKAAMSGFIKIAGLTTDPKEAMDFADIVMMMVPAFGQETIFELVLPHLRDGQTFVLMPGNFGSLIFRQMMRKAKINKQVTFVEATSIPYAVRIIGPGTIYMLGVKTAFSAGALPSKEIGNAIKKLNTALTLKIIPLANVLEAGMSNANMIIHVPTSTLNMGLAESTGGKGQFYRDGISPTVAKVLEKMDQERLAVGQAFGLKLMSFVEIANKFYDLNVKSIRQFVVETPYHNNVPDDFPKGPKDRYITEDCPAELVPVSALGRLAGTPCPTMEAIITIDNVYNDADYFTEGRSLEKMGLTGMSVQEIMAFAENG